MNYFSGSGLVGGRMRRRAPRMHLGMGLVGGAISAEQRARMQEGRQLWLADLKANDRAKANANALIRRNATRADKAAVRKLDREAKREERKAAKAMLKAEAKTLRATKKMEHVANKAANPYYCGLRKRVPRGKVRGTYAECLADKQVRYYGRHTRSYVPRARRVLPVVA